MEISIKILDDLSGEKYDSFLKKDENSLFFASNKYRKFLKAFLGQEDHYFMAIDHNGEIKGLLPSFIGRSENSGCVLNSLPFYGSNGALIEHEGNVEVKEALLRAFRQFATDNKCISSTLITSPFEKDVAFYDACLRPELKDKRIGQVTPLPGDAEELMNLFHYKTRNVIRKALKNGIEIKDEYSREAMDFLISTHEINITAVNGLSKPDRFFRLIDQHFTYGEDYKIYTAYKDGKPIAALLLFYFNKTVEYFTPVVVEEHRTLHPLSLLIFHAMKEAVAQSYLNWNWGGTWLSQDGVYNFKKRWGTRDLPYYYYVNLYDDKISDYPKKLLFREFPYFYVIPFSLLKSN